MITFDRILAVSIVLWIFIRTLSYGRWTWRKGNRLGAVMLLILALSIIFLPVYTQFFRK